MANTFKNTAKALTTTTTMIYTCPGNTSAVVHAVYLSNIDAINEASATIKLFDNTQNSEFNIGLNLPIAINSTLIFENPINLEANDELRMQAGANNDVEVVISVLEII